MSAPDISIITTSAPKLSAEGEREIARVLAKFLADRHPGTRWSTTWPPPAPEDRRAT